MKAELEVIRGAAPAKVRLDPSRSINVGRSKAADFQVVAAVISRLHCQLQHDGQVWILTDLESRNGTWLEGERIHAGEIKDGQSFTLGKQVEIRFSVVSEESEAPVADDAGGVVGTLVGKEIGGIRITDAIAGPGPLHRLRGHQPSLNRPVLVHAYPKGQLAAAGLKDRLLAEVRRISKLLHPGVLQIYDFIEHPSAYLVVMEYFAAPTLQEILEKRKFVRIAGALKVASQVADALAHAQGQELIVDRLTPGEIFVNDDHTAKLQFFRPPFPQQVGPLALTYVAPEVISSGRLRTGADQPDDPAFALPCSVYSLGAILYHMLAGIPPHDGETQEELLPKILKKKPPVLSRVNMKVSPALARIVERAMEKDPSLRPADFIAFRTDLGKIVSPAR